MESGTFIETLEYIDSINDLEKLKELSEKNSCSYLSNLFWQNRRIIFASPDELEKERAILKCKYILQTLGASIPFNSSINEFRCPHGLMGIFISLNAQVGKDCAIFQHVTIGSNTLKDSKTGGFPVIGDNVYIGAGAKIIGNVRIGNNVRIGANCCVVNDVPDNSVVVMNKPRIIQKEKIDNSFISADDYKKWKSEQESPAEIISCPNQGGVGYNSFEEAFKITFTGDLLLLEDQVKRAYHNGKYDFADMFEYAESYIKSDLAIGVLEGPIAGAEKGFTVGNFDDGKKLYFNYPDEFGQAIKNAGFDLVTTANNHLLDKGESGALRTIDFLDEIGLEYIGTYRSQEEKDKKRCKIIEKDGIRFAVLAYTSSFNYHDMQSIIKQKPYITSFIRDTEGELFDQLKNSVENDFKYAKSFDPDFIIVLPHIGSEFSNFPCKGQNVWYDVFLEFGADIILGCHAHAVQPVKINISNQKSTFIAYCPGNFANLYRKKQGDASAIVEVYIDRKSKKIIGGGIVPLYTQSKIDGNFRALPIYEIEYNQKLRMELSTDDYDRASFAHDTITRVMLGRKLDMSNIQKHYLFDENNIIRQPVKMTKSEEEFSDSAILKKIKKYKSICFLGDSLTEGTKNNGVPWYEPLLSLLNSNTQINNFSKGACTVKYLTDNILQIPKSELYIVAIGTNDVRYRNKKTCAMTSEKYIEAVSNLRTSLKQSCQCDFIFIAPWTSTDGDPYSKLNYEDKIKLNNEYSSMLQEFCCKHNDVFVDCNKYIEKRFKEKTQKFYLIDHIHPNASEGVKMYSEAFLNFKILK